MSGAVPNSPDKSIVVTESSPSVLVVWTCFSITSCLLTAIATVLVAARWIKTPLPRKPEKVTPEGLVACPLWYSDLDPFPQLLVRESGSLLFHECTAIVVLLPPHLLPFWASPQPLVPPLKQQAQTLAAIDAHSGSSPHDYTLPCQVVQDGNTREALYKRLYQPSFAVLYVCCNIANINSMCIYL